VKGGLHVGNPRAHLAALPSLAALLPWGWFLVGHALRSRSLPGRRGCRRRRLLLDHDALTRTLARARVGVGALPPYGQTAPVSDAPVAADVHQPLHVHRDLATQVTLDLDLPLDDVADARDLFLRPRLHPLIGIHLRAGQDPPRRRPPDPINIGDRHLSPLLPR